MFFKDILGQDALKQRLIQAARTRSVPHAQLFLGPLGHGGLPLALAFSSYLNCEQPGDTDSCGVCPSCVKAQKHIHPDIHYTFPFPRIASHERCDDFIKEWRAALLENPYLDLFSWMARFEAENKQPNIPIKECHDIIRKLSLKAYESQYKTLILWLPEYLGKEGNALLKIIEEPPDHTVFLLVAESTDAVLPTILSRTQIVKVPHIEHRQLADALEQREGVDNASAFRLAVMVHGDLIEAMRQVKHSVAEFSGLFSAWLELCLPAQQSRALDIYNWIEKFALIGRENQKSFFKHALHFLHDTLYLRTTGAEPPSLTRDERALAQRLAESADAETFEKLYLLLNEAHYHIERNAHSRMLLMSLTLKTAALLKRKKVILTEH